MVAVIISPYGSDTSEKLFLFPRLISSWSNGNLQGSPPVRVYPKPISPQLWNSFHPCLSFIILSACPKGSARRVWECPGGISQGMDNGHGLPPTAFPGASEWAAAGQSQIQDPLLSDISPGLLLRVQRGSGASRGRAG